MYLHGKKYWRLFTTTRSQDKGKEYSSLVTSHSFGFLVYWSTKEQISVVFSHPVCGSQLTNRATSQMYDCSLLMVSFFNIHIFHIVHSNLQDKTYFCALAVCADSVYLEFAKFIYYFHSFFVSEKFLYTRSYSWMKIYLLLPFQYECLFQLLWLMLHINGKNGQHCLIPPLWVRIKSFTTKYEISCEFFIDILSQVEELEFLSIPSLLNAFWHLRVLNFVESFFWFIFPFIIHFHSFTIL